MKRLSLRGIALLGTMALFGLIFVSSNANAQYPYNYNNGYYQQGSQVAINNGYQLGYGQGSNDRAYGASFDINRSKAYRDADSGYRNSGLNRDEYRSLFRQGFQAGYQDGYNGGSRRGYFNGGSSYNNGYYNNGYYNRRYYNNDRRYYDNDDYYNHRRYRRRVYSWPY